MLENKFPGKDISNEDIKSKFPLVAKKNSNHFSKFKVQGIEFGGKKFQFLQVQIWLREKLILDCAYNIKKIEVFKRWCF